MHARLSMLFAALVLFGVLPAAKGGYRFEILLVHYQNPTHRDHHGGYCERSSSTNPCDNAFKICIRTRGASTICDIGSFETTRISENSDYLTFSEGDVVGGVLNPLTTSGDTWPGEVEINLKVYDIDGTNNRISASSDLVTTFIIHPIISNTHGTYSQLYTYTSDYSTLKLKFRLTCLPPHTGHNCSQLITTTTLPYSTMSATSITSSVLLHTHSAKEITSTSVVHIAISSSLSLSMQTSTTVIRTSSSLSKDSDILRAISSVEPVYTVTAVPPITNPTVEQPSEAEDLPLSVTLAIICVGTITVLAILTLIILLLVIIKKKRKNSIDIRSFDDSAFKTPNLNTVKGDCSDHVYDIVKGSSFSTSPTAQPTYAVVNAMYGRTESDSDDGMKVEKNVAYASVNVERNVAYAVARDPRYRPRMPLPHQQ